MNVPEKHFFSGASWSDSATLFWKHGKQDVHFLVHQLV